MDRVRARLRQQALEAVWQVSDDAERLGPPRAAVGPTRYLNAS